MPEVEPVVTLDTAFYLCDLYTGDILANLPLKASGDLINVLAREDQTQFTLDVFDDNCPDDWQDALEGGKTMIVQTITYDGDEQPAQTWAVTSAKTGTAIVPISSYTLEHCLNRCYVRDIEGTADEADVLDDIAAELPLRYGFIIDKTPTGTVQDYSYTSDSARTVYDVMTERMRNQLGGEWRVYTRWHDDTDRRRFDKVLQIGPRVGVVRDHAIFDLAADGSGTIESYTREKTWLPGTGATMLIGVIESSNADPTPPQLATDLIAAGWPVWEDRETYADLGDVLNEDAALLDRTRTTLADRRDGTLVWTVIGNAGAPRPGRDFYPGDTVTIDVDPQPPVDPAGGSATVRVLGYELNPTNGQVTVRLWEDTDG